MAATFLGRFEVRRRLGSGGQSAVFLAHDPDLRRDVAVKLLRSAPGSDAIRREAHAVAALKHRNIVPIHDLGEQDGRVYLVFDYVDGRTLAQALAADGPMAPRRAAEVMRAVLDALAAAHERGVIHRDLKPSNILLDAAGEPHVMDFGIATPVGGADGEAELSGSPAYMAPEYIARRVVTEQYDVYAAGLVFYEMLFGRRAVQGDNPFQALHQNANVPLTFPAGAHEAVGPQLVDVIVKATAKEPELRFASCRQMQQALDAYLKPVDDAAPAGKAHAGTLDFLLRRMKVKGDFPAMSAAMSAIQRIASSNRSNVSSLANAILKDLALTNKILRLVNSAYYAGRSGERIRTVTRAIVMMGFDAVRSIAISLMLFDRIRDKQHAATLREEFMRASLAGALAREIANRLNPGQAEEAFICALFHKLGRLLTCYYFWEEAEAIRRLIGKEHESEEAAARRVLGIGYTELGMAVAESWGFPASISQSMKPFGDGRLPRPANADAQLHQLSALANETCAALEAGDAAAREAALARLSRRYGDSLGLAAGDLDKSVKGAVDSVTELAQVLNLDLRQTALGRSLCGPEVAAPVAGEPASTPALVESEDPPEARSAEAILTAGIQDISMALVEELPASDLLRIVAETIYRALDVRRVIICRRDASGSSMKACLGIGADADELAKRFAFGLGGKDLFNTILGQDAGVLIRDSSEARIRERLPPWYVTQVDAPTFIIFPMNLRRLPLAMIYADKDVAGSLRIEPAALALVHTLRNQALLTLKQVP